MSRPPCRTLYFLFPFCVGRVFGVPANPRWPSSPVGFLFIYIRRICFYIIKKKTLLVNVRGTCNFLSTGPGLIGRGPRTEHTFSAFWLRSSVVSVLISLISGTWRMASQEFKFVVSAVVGVSIRLRISPS